MAAPSLATRPPFDEVGRSDVLHLRNFASLLCMCVANGSTDIPHVRGTLHCRSIERNSFPFPFGEPVRRRSKPGSLEARTPVRLDAWPAWPACEPASL